MFGRATMDRPKKASYGWVHVVDWLGGFLAAAAASSIILVMGRFGSDLPLQALGLLGLAAVAWPLTGYLLSWFKQDPAAWYGELLSLAVQTGDEKVLDVGCGLGRSTILLAKRLRGGRVAGIDVFSKRALWGNSIERAGENALLEGVADKVEFAYGNAVRIPFGDNRFDVVVAAYVTHELRKAQDRALMMREVHRVLRPGGRFVAGEIPRSAHTFLRFLWFGFWFLPLEHLLQLRAEAGFDAVKVAALGRPVVVYAEKSPAA